MKADRTVRFPRRVEDAFGLFVSTVQASTSLPMEERIKTALAAILAKRGEMSAPAPARVPKALRERAERWRARGEEAASFYGTTLAEASKHTRDPKALRVRYAIARELLTAGASTPEAGVLLGVRHQVLLRGIEKFGPALRVMVGGRGKAVGHGA